MFDMLAYFDHNVQLSEMTNYITSLATFTDSSYSLKRG